MFRNKALDLVYNPTSHGYQAVNSLSGNVAYEYPWKQIRIKRLIQFKIN